MEALRPEKVKMPTIDPFDEATDPDDYLDVYKAQMCMQDIDDATYYHCFLTTLKWIAQKWFNELHDGSITFFVQLLELFRAHFISNKRE